MFKRVSSRTVISVSLLLYVVYHVGKIDIVDAIFSVKASFFGLACSAFSIGQLLNSLRWKILVVSVRPTSVKILDLFALNLVGMYYNFFTPSTIGGDVLQAEAAKRHIGGRWASYVTIILNRVIALFAVVVLAVTFSLIWLIIYEGNLWNIFYMSLLFFSTTIIGLVSLFFFKQLTAFIGFGERRWQNWALTARNYFVEYVDKTGMIIIVFFIAIISNIVGQIAVVWFISVGIGVDVPVFFHFAAVPIVILVTLVPITLNGIGLREAAFVYLYTRVGVAAADAVAMSVVLTAMLVLFGLMGGLATLSPRYRLSLK